MFRFTQSIQNYSQEISRASNYIGQGFSVTFDHMNRQPITVHYPYGELVPSESCITLVVLSLTKALISAYKTPSSLLIVGVASTQDSAERVTVEPSVGMYDVAYDNASN